ncbi:6146_t:CDS:1, partial [Ambispora leptoticha]
DILSQNDELSQDITLTLDTAIENESVKHKKKELYLLLDHVKTIIDQNTQTPNAEQWINSIDKNFNALRKMVDDYTQLERKHNIPNTWEGRNHNTFWI